jgi:hypothetical protein
MFYDYYTAYQLPFENTRRHITDEGAVFVPVCPHCCRFVRPDDHIAFNGLGAPLHTTNARCIAHNRVAMPFEGWV